MICEAVPDFAKFTYQEFSEALTMTISRCFRLMVNGVETIAFVPFADMVNHKYPKSTKWEYDNQKMGFVLKAIKNIAKDEPVSDSYGVKCNSEFFVDYGFVNE